MDLDHDVYVKTHIVGHYKPSSLDVDKDRQIIYWADSLSRIIGYDSFSHVVRNGSLLQFRNS